MFWMNRPPDTGVERLAERVWDWLEPRLTADLDKAARSFMRRAYRGTILPYHLLRAAGQPPAVRRKKMQMVTREIYGRLHPLPPRERGREAIADYYRVRLAVLSAAAEETATAFVDRSLPAREATDRAAKLLALLQQLADEAETGYPWLMARLKPELSEALLDCRHVLGQTKGVSLRLNRYLRQRQSARGTR